MNINMKVDELPARTYRWLKLNDAQIQEEDVEFSRFSIPVTSLPLGVNCKEEADANEAEAIFRDSHEKRLAADKGLVGPNGDTSPEHEKQIVRTGMGSAVDHLLDSAKVKATVITAAEGQRTQQPVVFHEVLGEKESVLSRQVIVVPKNAELTVIMDYNSEENADGFEGISTKFYLGENAVLHLIKVQMLGNKVTHFDDLGGVLEEGASLDFVEMELGASKAYAGSYFGLLGKESKTSSNTGYLARGTQFYDFNYVAEQRGKKTESLATFRGILQDGAQKNWRGSLDFREGSCGSIGDEQEDTLLLSPEVINRSIPLILCGEEDVDGRHGATIGQLSDDMLFYMEARGIDKEFAKKIMVRARLDSIARMIPDEDIKTKVSEYLDNIL